MKAKEVLEKLNITRPTLTKYVKEGLIKVDSTINGQYNYNEDSVNKLLGKESVEKVSIKLENDNLDKVIQIENLLIDIFYQLTGMKLLTSESILKLQEADRLFKSIKK